MKSDDATELVAAAQYVGMIQEGAAETLLLEVLNKQKCDRWTRYYVAEAYQAIRDRGKLDWARFAETIVTSRKRTIALLSDPNGGWSRRYLIELIGERRAAGFAATMREIYFDANAHERHSIIDALGEMRSDENTAFLLSTFYKERVPRVRANVVWAIANAGDVNGLGVILRGLNDPHPLVRTWSEWARIQFGRIDLVPSTRLRYLYPSIVHEGDLNPAEMVKG